MTTHLTTQLSFPDPTVANGSKTSAAAAEAIKPHAPRARDIVQHFIDSRGADGATRSEIAAGTGLKENTVNGRVNELLRAEPDPLAYEMGRKRDGRAVVVSTVAYRVLMRELTHNINRPTEAHEQ